MCSPINGITYLALTEVALKTLLKHSRKRGHKLQAGDHTEEATDDIFFDECVAYYLLAMSLGLNFAIFSEPFI